MSDEVGISVFYKNERGEVFHTHFLLLAVR